MLSIQPKFSVQPIEIQMGCANHTEIFRNRRTNFGAFLPFPFQPFEITVPFALKILFSFCYKSAYPYQVRFCSTNKIASLDMKLRFWK